MNNQNETNRQKFINNVLELSINSGKVNENAKYILYSEEEKEKRKEKIIETKENLCNIIKNVTKIAESLEISVEEILKNSK
ncbi:MAG: hypothetical protein HFJ60_05480 [Clostridia bacterium]|jgi:hypothetical protein|nr:hypothetical protein [Clostridia bacterium]